MARKRVKVPVRTEEERRKRQEEQQTPEQTTKTAVEPVQARAEKEGAAPGEVVETPSATEQAETEKVEDIQKLVEEIETLRRELERARAEAEEYKDRYLRAAAEMDNMRKRLEKRYADEAEQEKLRFLRAILPVIDHLEMVLKHSGSDPDVLRQGVEMTLQEFLRTLEREGVKPIHSVGQPFDPFIHEAVEAVETDEVPPGTVVDEVQKGYMYKDKLLRPARVRVAREKQG